MRVDKDLIKRCIKRDRKAQHDLYELCFHMLMPVCFRYKCNEEMSREILNQGFLKIIMNLKKYKTNVPFDAWCKRIMINTIIDEHRKEKKNKESMRSTDFADEKSVRTVYTTNTAVEKIEEGDLATIMMQVPEMSRKVFNLYAMEGYKHHEIGEMLKISEGTSKWHVANARKILQELVKKSINVMVSILL